MSNRKRKLPIWLPYTDEIISKKQDVTFRYKGGELTMPYDRIQSIMFYGAVCPLEDKFLDMCVREQIPVCIHRRNMHKAIWITGSIGSSVDDVLTQQIIFRNNQKKSIHIARRLLKAKFESMFWCYGHENMSAFTKLRNANSISELRNIESIHARKYWGAYYKKFGFTTPRRRKEGDDLKGVLDAISKLTCGILLRWVTYHKLSPYHGFLHIPTDYPSLIYDLIEPYRGYVEKEVMNTLLEMHKDKMDKKNMTAFAIKRVEDLFDRKVYTHQTRQIVTFQELLHGNVLALRSYLLGHSKRFIVPVPGRPLGGRPVQTGYKLYGRSAGPTDFQQSAERVAQEWFLKTDRA